MHTHPSFRETFGAPRALIGMIHVGALPGTPASRCSLDQIVFEAVEEARVFHTAGYTALMIENMHDRPYLNGAVGPEVVAGMTAVAREIRRQVPLPLGVQVLAGANREAIAVAHSSGASFVRAEGFVFAHVADEGVIESCAGDLLRYRRSIGAEDVRVYVDIKKKHSAHAITADVPLAETARAAEFFLADGVIVTGTATGAAAEQSDVEEVADAVKLPVFVGSGLSPDNVARYSRAQGFIVGSSIKQGGHWSHALDPGAVRAMAAAFQALEGAR